MEEWGMEEEGDGEEQGTDMTWTEERPIYMESMCRIEDELYRCLIGKK
jgi:hypothetical protein